MKGSERAIISGAVVFVLAVAFYMLVLSPKRAEVSELDLQIEEGKVAAYRATLKVSFKYEDAP